MLSSTPGFAGNTDFAGKTNRSLLRGDILYFTENPADHGRAAYCYIENGALLVDNGKIHQIGQNADLTRLIQSGTEVFDYPDGLIMPGFIDTHIHYPQTDMIASYGEHLLQWLEKYTFPTETSFSDFALATGTADFFLNELLRNGTTTACVYGSVHPQSVDAFFSASQRRNMRMICGKVLMDRHAPALLRDTPESAYQQSKTLIDRWHHNGRQLYALTPRFAITSSPEQLGKLSLLLQEYPDLWVQTHIAEDKSEVNKVNALYPDAAHYLDVYDRYGLLTPKSIFAHGIYLTSEEIARLKQAGSGIAFCPSSNMFLGSGLLDLQTLTDAKVNLSLATDVGAGTSFSMLQTMADAYKVARLTGSALSSLQTFYMATLGNARAIKLDDWIGSFNIGSEADMIVLDKSCTPLLSRRIKHCNNLEEILFIFMILGDDRAVKATWVNGSCVYEKQHH